MTRPRDNQIVNFVVSADHRIICLKSEKSDKYLDIAWQLKNYGT